MDEEVDDDDDDEDDNLGEDDVDPAMADGQRMRDSNLAVKTKQNYQRRWTVVENYVRTHNPKVLNPITNEIPVKKLITGYCYCIFLDT